MVSVGGGKGRAAAKTLTSTTCTLLFRLWYSMFTRTYRARRAGNRWTSPLGVAGWRFLLMSATELPDLSVWLIKHDVLPTH